MKNFTIILGIVTVLVILPFVYPFEKKENVAVPTMEQNGMCLQGIYQEGFSIQESEAGEYKYELYATSKGIEVWTECKNI